MQLIKSSRNERGLLISLGKKKVSDRYCYFVSGDDICYRLVAVVLRRLLEAERTNHRDLFIVVLLGYVETLG